MPGQLIRRTWASDPTVDAPARYRRACQYEAYIPDELSSLEFTLEARLAGLIAGAEHAVQALNLTGGSALAPLARLLLRTESIASSKVEGLQLGVRELARAEAKADVGGKLGTTALEVLANIDAMSIAVEEAAVVTSFGVDEIRAIHHRLMVNGPHSGIAGVVRTRQNWIGGNDYNPCGADFVPPPPDEVDRLLADLCTAINDSTLSPLVQAAIVHAQFETLHPFDDGNGRTGRALVHVVLRRRGLAPRFLPPVSVVFAGARDRYITGLTSFRGTDIARWIEQFAAATWEATRLASAYVLAVRDLQSAWRERLATSAGAPREGAAAWALIDALPAHPIISGPMAAAATGRAKAAIYAAIDQLVAAGVLEPLSENKRNRSWEAVGLLTLVARLEEGALPI
ncbi:MAG: Fic family protein [Gemmatimonadaceae bacterium]